MNNEIKLFNTASRKTEVFKPIKPGEVDMYACGPTVYSYAHIGNMRAYVTWDLLQRTFKKAGHNVKYAMNITDVGHLQSDADAGDDKMAVAAKRENRTVWDIAQQYTDAFFDHSKKLNIQRPNIVCKATDHIDDMITMVEKLIEKGHAYESGGNVYFSVASYERYADFAGLHMDAGQQTDRVEADLLKRDQSDFALWFSVSNSKFPNQVMKWNSPWGKGFPGWHIECSAMATKYLGEHFDIHCGGIDHVTVHHTNEVAQAECAHGNCGGGKKPWVNTWLHSEFLQVDGKKEKMSKSKGDTITVDTLTERGYDPLAYRYLLLTAHYQNQVKFSWTALDQASQALNNIRNRVKDIKSRAGEEKPAKLSKNATQLKDKFWNTAYDNLSTAKALTVLQEVLKAPEDKASAKQSESIVSTQEKLALIRDFEDLLALDLEKEESLDIPEEIRNLLNLRNKAKQNKNWKEADALRKQIEEKGYNIKDTPKGSVLEPA